MEGQLMPPAAPPFPTAEKRPFQSLGRKSPNWYDDVAELVTLMVRAQSAGSAVELAGYAASLLSPYVPFAGTGTAWMTVALEVRRVWKAAAVHFRAETWEM
jgi:hypothetical protein